MATNNSVDTSLVGQTGTGTFVGAISPTIKTPTVVDTNGNNVLMAGTTATAVNYVQLFNRAAGGPPYFMSTGSDTNIGFLMNLKGTGIFQVATTNTIGATFITGTAQQHTANLAFANTATGQTITMPDGNGTIAFNSGFTAWTPTFTFATPGNLSVSYASQVGNYVKIGNVYHVTFTLTCTPTFTTASGNLQITGLPVTSNGATGNTGTGNLYMQGTYTWPVGSTTIAATNPSGSSRIEVIASGIATVGANLTSANFTTGTSVTFVGSLFYLI